ncbi:MAG: replicative DNA helicase [candidate division NC10 bacterium]|nr:replicative DNA helicase [candidate division NC10 bacterium]
MNRNPNNGSDLLELPPQNLDLERQVLHCMIEREEARVFLLANLAPDHFYDERHRVLFSVAQDLYDRDGTLDATILNNALSQDRGRMEKCGGIVYLCEIESMDNWATPFNARIYVRDLRDLAKTRRDRQIGQALATGQVTAEERQALLDELAQPAWDGGADEESSAFAVAGRVVSDYEAAEALAKSGRKFAGLDSGFERLNLHLNGLCPGELTILAARPSIGKSTLALQIALSVAQTDQARVGIITLEMTRGQIGGRLAGLMSGVHPYRQRRGQLYPEERDRYFEALVDFSRLPLEVFVKDRTLNEIRSRMTLRPDVRLWIVDHLHRVAGGPGEKEHERLGGIANTMADMAVQLDRHVLLVCQLNRECEKRPDKIPETADLRGSGSIEEHAVNVLLLYRPGYYKDLRKPVEDDPEALREMLTATRRPSICSQG